MPDSSDNHQVTIAPEQAGERLDRALAMAVPALSRSRVKALILEGRVRESGATISDPSRRVKPGQVFVVEVPEARASAVLGQAIALDIRHEDDDLIVIDKPAGMVVHPAPGSPDRTLVNALIAHCGASLSGIGGERRPGIVHRLDKDTSGLMVAAKNDAAHQALAEAFARRDIERVYVALVWGMPSPPEGTIDAAIGRSARVRTRMTVTRRGGRAALTRYRTVRVLQGGALALIECRLSTGRTHQIRVHLAAIGHPLVGDQVYGRPSRRLKALPAEAGAAIAGFKRQALDAVVLGFRHPRTGKSLRFTKEYAQDFKKLIQTLEGV